MGFGVTSTMCEIRTKRYIPMIHLKLFPPKVRTQIRVKWLKGNLVAIFKLIFAIDRFEHAALALYSGSQWIRTIFVGLAFYLLDAARLVCLYNAILYIADPNVRIVRHWLLYLCTHLLWLLLICMIYSQNLKASLHSKFR